MKTWHKLLLGFVAYCILFWVSLQYGQDETEQQWQPTSVHF